MLLETNRLRAHRTWDALHLARDGQVLVRLKQVPAQPHKPKFDGGATERRQCVFWFPHDTLRSAKTRMAVYATHRMLATLRSHL